MNTVGTSDSASQYERNAARVFRFAAIAFGAAFGLAFALLTWGSDAVILGIHHVDRAALNLLIGLPVAVILGALTGYVTSLSSSVFLSVVFWGVTGGVFGILAGHVPYDLRNWVIGWGDIRFRGLEILPFAHSQEVRTLLAALALAFVGLVVGFVEMNVIERVWDYATPTGKLSVRSWLVLWVCIPLALLPALVVNSLINQPLRLPLTRVGMLVETTLVEGVEAVKQQGLNYATAERYGDRFADPYTLHFVEFYAATDTLYSAFVDVEFPGDFVMRCATAGIYVNYCDDISRRFSGWVDDLIHAGLTGEQRWLTGTGQRIKVSDGVLAWLDANGGALTESFTVEREGQQGGYVWMRTRFDNGFEMHCRFRGAAPIYVEECVGSYP
ncbi:MAG: hypothetical protein JXB35_05960 [Anaerolineae bacterium]|nr:hypothetical protein [Anaerolineae bacterium]